MAAKSQGASIILVNRDLCVLLYLRDNKPEIPWPNCWDLPGGKVEAGESPEECISRELREEIELELQKAELFEVNDFDERIEHTFWAASDLDIAKTRLHEGVRLQWFSYREIAQLPDEKVGFGFKNVLLSFFRRKPWLGG